MAQYLVDFANYFGLYIFGQATLNVQQTLAVIIVAYIGLMLTMVGIRCIFELIKIITDRSNF